MAVPDQASSEQLAHLVPLVTLAAGLPPHADVAIIGGGIMGASIAFHLAEAGVGGVVLLERDTLGSGSSAKPLGGVRATFSDAGNVLLGQRSLEAFETFGARFGTPIGLRQPGYLFLCRTEPEMAAVADSVVLQNRLGCRSLVITPSRAHELNPFLDPDCLVGASYSPRDGYAEPALVVAGYAQAAAALGATIAERTEVLAVTARDECGFVLTTQRGELQADAIVIAAGAWSSALGDMVGVHLPVEGVRRQIGVTAQQPGPHPRIPFTLDLGSTLYFHNYRNALLLGISNDDEPAGMNREFTYGWTRAFDDAARVVAPSLVGQRLVGGWAGLYENTPDHNAMIGRSEVPGVFYATGFSGHGFLQGPAVGEVVRDLYLDREPFLDVAPFSADRFAGVRGLLHEVHII